MMFIHSHESDLTSPINAAQRKCETRVSALYSSCAGFYSTHTATFCVKQENGTSKKALCFVPISEISSSHSGTQATMYRVKDKTFLSARVNSFTQHQAFVSFLSFLVIQKKMYQYNNIFHYPTIFSMRIKFIRITETHFLKTGFHFLCSDLFFPLFWKAYFFPTPISDLKRGPKNEKNDLMPGLLILNGNPSFRRLKTILSTPLAILLSRYRLSYVESRREVGAFSNTGTWHLAPGTYFWHLAPGIFHTNCLTHSDNPTY